MRKLNYDDVEGKISEVQFYLMGEKTTVCCLTLDSGFEVIGTSSCLDVNDYNSQVGESISYDNAVKKLFEMESYHISEEAFQEYLDEEEEELDEEDKEDLDEDIFYFSGGSCDCDEDCECSFTRCKHYECEDVEDSECESCPELSCPSNKDCVDCDCDSCPSDCSDHDCVCEDCECEQENEKGDSVCEIRFTNGDSETKISGLTFKDFLTFAIKAFENKK